MRSRRLLAVAFGVAGVGLVIGPAGVAASAVADTQTCPVPVVGIDPDFVAVTAPVSSGPGTSTASVIASETAPELGAGAPVVRLFVFRQDGTSPVMDLLNGLSGPSTSGTASLSGPATGNGTATETITFSAPGSYTFGFLVLFDNGIHPCASLLPGNHSLTITVP